MHFLYPVFLSALAVLAIPVLVHLFHFRRYKTVLFSNVKFLKAVDTERKNQNRLRHLLVLASRLLAFAALVLAFAIPGCGDKKQSTGKSAVSIFIDNSFSMEQRGAKGILLETAKQKAREIVKSIGENAEYQIMSNEPAASTSVFTGPTEAIRKIDELQVSSRSPSLGKIWRQMQDQLANVPNEGRSGYIISDFQGSFVREIPQNVNNPVKINCLPLDPIMKRNIDVDTAWVENPFSMIGEKTSVKFRVYNYSAEALSELNVRLMLDNNMRGLAKMDIPAFAFAESSIEFTMPQAVFTKAWLEVDDPENNFDNKLYFSLQPQGDMPVTLKGANNYLEQALATNTFFKIQHESVGNSKVIYFAANAGLGSSAASELADQVRNGARAILIPAENLNPGAFKELESIFGLPGWKEIKKGKFAIDRNGLNHVFFNQVFSSIPKNMEMPRIYEYYSTSGSVGNGDAVLSLDNGDPLLIRFKMGKGFLYFFTAAFSTRAGNFVQSSLFLPVVVNCAFNYEQTGNVYGATAANKGYLLRNNFIKGENNLVLKNGGKEYVPEVQAGTGGQELFLGSYLNEAGFYTLQDKSGKGATELLALNYPRTESDPRPATEENLKLFAEKTGAVWMKADNAMAAAQIESADSRIWRLFIWLAAAFFAVEVLLLVFWDPVQARINRNAKPAGL